MQDVIQLFPEWSRLAAHLRGQIRSGELSPGDEIPSADQLIAEHSVSAHVVRYAMQALHTEGLVESPQGVNSFVVRA